MWSESAGEESVSQRLQRGIQLEWSQTQILTGLHSLKERFQQGNESPETSGKHECWRAEDERVYDRNLTA
ncbi:hypothetical protein AAFF_G00272510 [Aldrovandia affinis]|uniref:Uncharacterized protein n=1 Tax=Aldrovandia affinis TaxID=143900 RepID=A0AAD7RAW4_9TELE|nr:hypothetical protein AAFF_G00272510 [Aldrovandia affinis]